MILTIYLPEFTKFHSLRLENYMDLIEKLEKYLYSVEGCNKHACAN